MSINPQVGTPESYISAEHDIMNLEQELPTELPFYFGVKTRRGKNRTWYPSNYGPNCVYKTRMIYITVPKGVICTVTFKLQLIEGVEKGERCLLSRISKKPQNGLDTKKIRIHYNGNNENNLICFLHTMTDRSEASGLPKYKISIAVSVDNRKSTVHAWECKPLRNHKWESGKYGQSQNRTNATQAKFSLNTGFGVSFSVNNNPSLDIPPLFETGLLAELLAN